MMFAAVKAHEPIIRSRVTPAPQQCCVKPGVRVLFVDAVRRSLSVDNDKY